MPDCGFLENKLQELKEQYRQLYKEFQYVPHLDHAALCRMLTQLQQELAAQSLPVLLVGDGTQLCYQSFQSLLPAIQAAEGDRQYISGAAVAQLGILYAKQACNPAALQPVYLRLPQAQRELLKKQVDSK